MKKVFTAFLFLFGTVAHAAHLAPWDADGNGMRVGMVANGGGVVARRVSCGGVESFSYDLVGNLLSASNSVACEAFAYDLRDRLTNAVTQIGTNAFALSWSRDAGGLVTNVAYGAGRAVARTYDLAGRLVAVRDWLGHEWTLAWDGASRPTGGTSPGGTAHSFSYDMAGRLSAWSVAGVAGRTIERDAAGRRTRDTVTAGPVPTATLQRNAENTFDAADRLVSATVAYDGATTPVTETFLYDGNGAMTNATSGGETVFDASYDAQGRLASASIRGSGAPAASTAFSYDALGNRVGVGGHIFVPDHSDPLKRSLVECDADGTPIRYYIWGPGRLLGFIDAEGTLAVAHADKQGSVIALTDENGNLLYRAAYSPHGEDWGASGTNATPFAWLGGLGVMRLDATHNSQLTTYNSRFGPLYLTRHRLYSPVLRRFLSTDPLGIDGGLNLYAYANGDPLAYIDPLGLCSESTTENLFDYLGSSVNQIVKGNYTDDVTVLGTAGSVGLGLLGADLPMDIRDITYDFTHWEWSWSHVGQTTLDAVSVLPLVGVLKYTDEVTTLSKGGKKASVLSGRAIDKGNAIRRSSGPIIKTSTEARSIARMKGWTEVHGIKSSRKEVIFTDGRRFYTRDNTGHKGGVWKEVDRNGIRIRTLVGNLNPIGD